jgi:Kef-type K+ transport system membrane component KefB
VISHLLFEFALPLTNPVLRFLLILVIILVVPIVLNKVRIPHLLGLIIAGAVVGTNGLNLLERDSSIILSGTAGLLYIMFLAGLEIDLADFKKNSKKSLVFGMYTFCIPMILGILTGIYLLEFSIATSVLLASMFASHTLIAYPLISKFGVAKNIAVNITVGGTLITDTLALLVLAVVVGVSQGDVDAAFWIRLSVSITLFGLVVLLLFPIIGRWFFKRFDDNVSQYIFVLVMVFSGAVLAELAGIEPIIGAFLSGLALNRLIPHTSPLMNRIEFVGNAIFIPFFLIGVGMLIDYKVFFKDLETIKVAGIMIIVATAAKFIAAWLTQKTFHFSADQRRLIFGLSNAQAAATLAAVLVGYNIILGETDTGEPIRLLNEYVLNGTILMILFTCTVASFVAQKGAKNIALNETHDEETKGEEKILIPLSYAENTDELVNLGITIKSKNNRDGLYALSIIDNDTTDGAADKNARKLLHKAVVTAAATDNRLKEIIRYDLNILNGITSVIKEQKITELILGLHVKNRISDSFLGKLTEGILTKSNTTTLIYKPFQPFSTLKRHLIVVPAMAEKEIGFSLWLMKIWNIARNSGASITFFATSTTTAAIKKIQAEQRIECNFNEFDNWNDFLILSREINKNDNLIIIMSRRDQLSYQNAMSNIPNYLNTYCENNSFILIYPLQVGIQDPSKVDFNYPTLMEPIEKLGQLQRLYKKLFKNK